MNSNRLARITLMLVVTYLFRHRISVGLTLLYTYIAFTFSPAPILGYGDGWDLERLIPPLNASHELVPRIIHQVRLGSLQMKPSWIEANASCVALHPHEQGWRFELWDSGRANDFVRDEYPELLETYLGYGQEIQRSNAIRYLILYKYGGMYLDLDVRCKTSLEFFTTVDWVSPPGLPTGINNAFMAVRSGHPFLRHAIRNLQRFDLNWVSLYVTDMFSAGCHYISTMHATYPNRSTLRVLPPSYKLGGVSSTPIFDHLGAASWHRGDAFFIKFIGSLAERLGVITVIVAICSLLVAAIVNLWKAKSRRVEWMKVPDKEYVPLNNIPRNSDLSGRQGEV